MSFTQGNSIISATIYYYDVIYPEEVACSVLEILKRYHFFPPHKIHAGKLSRNRFILASENAEDMFIRSYSEKDVFGVDMSSGDSKTSTEFWRVDWGFTYYKNSHLLGACKMLPWNTITIQSTYGRLCSEVDAMNYMTCVKELIAILSPFYASIDNLKTKVDLMGKTQEEHFVPDKVQEIFWGNYWGPEFCQRYKVNSMLESTECHSEAIGNGIFFTLSESLHDSKTHTITPYRKRLKSHLR